MYAQNVEEIRGSTQNP